MRQTHIQLLEHPHAVKYQPQMPIYSRCAHTQHMLLEYKVADSALACQQPFGALLSRQLSRPLIIRGFAAFQSAHTQRNTHILTNIQFHQLQSLLISSLAASRDQQSSSSNIISSEHEQLDRLPVLTGLKQQQKPPEDGLLEQQSDSQLTMFPFVSLASLVSSVSLMMPEAAERPNRALQDLQQCPLDVYRAAWALQSQMEGSVVLQFWKQRPGH